MNLKMNFKRVVLAGAVVLAANFLLVGAAHAAAIIVHPSGFVALGVNDTGELNVRHDEVTPPYPSTGGSFPSVDGTGVRALFANAPEGLEFTFPGCLCEGWGVAIASLGITGYRNRAAGHANVSLVSFASTASTATSVVQIIASGSPVLEVTHHYRPSASPYLFQVDVKIKNISGGPLGSGPTDLRYRRVMDWDMEPTAFNEFVTIQGWPATNLFRTTNDGFRSADPLSTPGPVFVPVCPVNANFTKCGPGDHGALFDFAFPALGAGEERTFRIFYGAAPDEAAALAALAAVGAEVYSLGFPNIAPIGRGPVVAIFGFAGVGGRPVGPAVPEPSTFALMGSGLVGLVAVRWQRRRRPSLAC
jgi:hypothetical protein